MVGGIIGGLVIGWLGSIFGLDDLITKGLSELTGVSISSAGYYTIFVLLGALGGALKDRK